MYEGPNWAFEQVQGLNPHDLDEIYCEAPNLQPWHKLWMF